MVTFYRRNLPHWLPAGHDIFVTWRLKGSLPTHLRGIISKDLSGRRFLDLDRALDRGDAGPLWLRQPRIAECVMAALQLLREKQLAEVHAYAVMANHVHVLLTPASPLHQITRLLKGVTSRQANALLGFTGSHFWQDESFDHWVRGPGEWVKIREYIERNPVTAGIVARPEDFPWSSAWRRMK
jgi:putative transposase